MERVGDHRAFSSDTIQSLITAIGTGVTNGTGDGGDFDLSKARYHKIIIMTDADVDGAHIRILLMTFFYKYMRPLVEAGYVYSACPPIFGVKVGKKIHYVYPDSKTPEDELLAKAIEQYAKRNPDGTIKKPSVQRYKGLGEMDPQQLADTTMDPKTRILQRVTIEDAAAAERAVRELMGDQDGVQSATISSDRRQRRPLPGHLGCCGSRLAAFCGRLTYVQYASPPHALRDENRLERNGVARVGILTR